MPEREFTAGTGYRYGFNGQEMDDDVSGKGNALTAAFWEYSPRLGRRWNVDPISSISISPYSVFKNNSNLYIDPNGLYATKKEARQARKNAKAEGLHTSKVYKSGDQWGFNANDRNTKNAVVATFKRTDFSVNADPKPTVQSSSPSNQNTPSAISTGPAWAKQVITNWSHEWDGTCWGCEAGTGKYSPPQAPDGVVISVSSNAGHGSVGGTSVSVAVTGEGIGTYGSGGAGTGSEGLNTGIGVAFLWKTAYGEKSYPGKPLPLQDIGGSGIQVSGSVGAGISVGGSYGQNHSVNGNLNSAPTYRSFGINAGIGAASAPVTGSVQITGTQPLLMLDFNKGFYLGKGKD